MRDAVQCWDTLVRGTISKGRFVQGAQHPRTFGRGHINPASSNHQSFILVSPTYPLRPPTSSKTHIVQGTHRPRKNVGTLRSGTHRQGMNVLKNCRLPSELAPLPYTLSVSTAVVAIPLPLLLAFLFSVRQGETSQGARCASVRYSIAQIFLIFTP
jgi:hypothetical protein